MKELLEVGVRADALEQVNSLTATSQYGFTITGVMGRVGQVDGQLELISPRSTDGNALLG